MSHASHYRAGEFTNRDNLNPLGWWKVGLWIKGLPIDFSSRFDSLQGEDKAACGLQRRGPDYVAHTQLPHW